MVYLYTATVDNGIFVGFPYHMFFIIIFELIFK